MTLPCQCRRAGPCERHPHLKKAPHLWKLCQTRADYRALWDAQAAALAASGTIAARGLGDTVAKLTSAIGIPSCGDCLERQAALNGLFPYRPKRKTR